MRTALLDKIAQSEDYSILHKQGVSIQEIRGAIRNTLEPYLRNSNLLDTERLYYLAGEAINIRRLSLDPLGPQYLNEILDLYWSRYRTAPGKCTSLVAQLDSHVQAGKTKYISISLLERDKEGMDTETFAHDVLQLIGTTIEGPIRPFLDEMLCLFNMEEGDRTPSNVLAMTLGEVVVALSATPLDPSFLNPCDHGLSLSQWRNVAQHLAFAVAGDKLTVSYGRNRPRELTIMHDDLMPLLRQVILRLSVMKAARVLFTWDNIQEIGPKLPGLTEHPDSLLTDLTATFLTQGFRVCDAQSDSVRLLLSVEDLRAEFEDPNVRAIHSSQFLAMMARRSPNKALVIEYVDTHRGRSCEFALSKADAQHVAECDDPLSALAQRFTFKKGPNKMPRHVPLKAALHTTFKVRPGTALEENCIDQLRDYVDDRLIQGCVYCGGNADTRDHVPFKYLIDRPYPENLPVVGCCKSCNQEFSKDEEYFICLIESVLCGSTDPERIRRPSVARILRESPALRARIESTQTEVNGQVAFFPEAERVSKVMLKLARGHAAFKLSQSCSSDPDHFWYGPLVSLPQEQREAFDSVCSLPTSIRRDGSRNLPRILVTQLTLQSESGEQQLGMFINDWVIVQDMRYRYLVVDDVGGIVIRIVVAEYLACEVAWRHNSF